MTFKWTDRDALESACRNSKNATEVLKSLGFGKGGWSYRTLKKYAALYDIEIPVDSERPGIRPLKSLDEVLVQNSSFGSGTHLKEKLIKEGRLKEECSGEFCLIDAPVWLGKPLVFQLEHINGVPTDNRIENLCLLCPNCHTQTKTWGRKNRIMVL